MYYLPKDAEYYVQSHPKEISDEMCKIHLLKECRSGNKAGFKLFEFLKMRFKTVKPAVGKTHSRPI